VARVVLHPGLDDRPILLVAISRRNLLTLVSKLLTPGSRCEIWNDDVPSAFAFLRLRAEPDDIHYNSPTRLGVPPGPMHPVTEKVLQAIESAIADLGVEDIGADVVAGEDSAAEVGEERRRDDDKDSSGEATDDDLSNAPEQAQEDS
jgi:hypothetical protein